MPDYIVTAPNGKKFRVTAPEGATQEQVLAYAQSQFQASPAESTPSPAASSSPVSGSGLENFAAGAGKAVTDAGLGARQRYDELIKLFTGGFVPEAATVRSGEVAEKRRLDAPLMDTKAGKAGAITGGVALSVPLSSVPGANTSAGATALSALYGALQPSESGRETFTNTVIGGALGRGGQDLGSAATPFISRAIAGRKAASETARQVAAPQDDLMKQARSLGYVVPPSTANPNIINTTLESLSGKSATQQAAAVRNQKITNDLVRKELGISERTPISRDTLKGIRTKAGKAYEEVSASGRITVDEQYLNELGELQSSVTRLSQDFPELNVGASKEISQLANALRREQFDAESAVELGKKLRDDASANLSFAASADPAKRALGHAQRDAAAIVEDQLIRHLEKIGKGDLAKKFNDARVQIAKTYTVEDALNEATGNVQARRLGAQLKKGKPLSGNLDIAARFAESFPKAADEITHSPGVSAFDSFTGIGSAVAMGNPLMIAAPFVARGTGRAAILSGPYQNRMLTPSYNENAGLLRMLEATSNRGLLAAPAGLALAND